VYPVPGAGTSTHLEQMDAACGSLVQGSVAPAQPSMAARSREARQQHMVRKCAAAALCNVSSAQHCTGWLKHDSPLRLLGEGPTAFWPALHVQLSACACTARAFTEYTNPGADDTALLL
jgi:hypothetical protein